MQIEIRAGGAHLTGYANVTEKKSRPVITPHGKVIEEILPGAFAGAIERAENIALTKDHDPSKLLAETRAGSLVLYEDSIGLHYDADITDEETVEEARAGKIRGVSFGMRNVTDTLEQRAEELPLRRIKGLDMDHITLVVQKVPVYSATSVEIRAGEPVDVETRGIEDAPRVEQVGQEEKPSVDGNAVYRARVEAIRKK